MKTFVTAFAILVCVIMFVGNIESLPAVSHSSVNKRVIHLHKNQENFKEHKCGSPKPELHYLGEEPETERYKDMVFYPPAVVVNRCSRNTGCCTKGGKCTVDAEELVIFQVEAVVDDGITAELSIPLSNHVSCKCVDEDDD